MSKLNDKQIANAKELMKKHGKEAIYVIAETGQMYFSKNNAAITAKGKEVVEVKAAVEKKAEVKEPKVKEPKAKEPEVKEPVSKEPEVKEPEVKEPELKEPQSAKAEGAKKK